MEALLREYKEWLRTANAGPRTAESTAHLYTLQVKQALNVLEDPLTVTEKDIFSWRRTIDTFTRYGKKVQAKESTINFKIGAIKNFFQFLVDTGRRETDPSEGLRMVKVPQRLPKPVDDTLVQDLIEHIENTSPRNNVLQDLALVEIAYGSGLRRAELAHLTLGNISDRYSMRIIGKGDKERMVPLTEPAYLTIRDLALKRYGDEETKHLLERIDEDAAFTDLCKRKPDLPLFISPSGMPLPEMRNPGSFIYRKFRTWGEELGMSENLTPHRLRHAYATELLNNGADLLPVGESLGHEDLRTTRGYTKITKKGIQRLRATHPRQLAEAT